MRKECAGFFFKYQPHLKTKEENDSKTRTWGGGAGGGGGGGGSVDAVVNIESAHDKTYYKICSSSKDSDQLVHPRSDELLP